MDRLTELPETVPVNVDVPVASESATPDAPWTWALTSEPDCVTFTLTPVEDEPDGLVRIPHWFCCTVRDMVYVPAMSAGGSLPQAQNTTTSISAFLNMGDSFIHH